MPIFEFTSPEGKSYEIEGPEGATQEQAFQLLQQQLGGSAPAQQQQTKVDPTKSQESIPDVESIRQERAQYEQQKAAQTPLEKTWETVKEEGGRFLESLAALPGPVGAEGTMGAAASYLSRLTGAQPYLEKGAQVAGAGIKTAGQVAGKAVTMPVKAATYPVKYITSLYKTAKTGVTEADASANALRMAARDIQQGRMTEISSQLGPDAEKVLTNLSEDISKKEVSVQDAENLVSNLQQRQSQSQFAVEHLNQEILNRPQMSTDEFGKLLQDTAYNFYRDSVDTREQMAGFGKAIREAGSGLKVDTSGVDQKIQKMIKSTRNPNTLNVLNAIRSQLVSSYRNKEVNKLSMESTDSLRKYLDKVLSTKRASLPSGQTADASELRFEINQIRRSLMKEATTVNPAYKQALYNYAKYSRALDPFRSKGGMKGIQEMDPFSHEFQMTQTQVVGKLLSGAKAGKDSIARLIEVNPEIKNAARQYFSKELFSKGMPSDTVYSNFLKNNEGVLRQSGLWDEFKNIRSARQAAKSSMDAAEYQTKLAETYLGKEKAGLTELGKQKTKAEVSLAKQETLKETQRGMQANLNYLEQASPTESVKFSKGIVDSALKEGRITPEEHSKYVSQINEIESKSLSAKEAKQKLMAITKKVFGIGIAGYVGEKAVSSVLGGY